MAFVRTMARQMGHGVERTDVNLALRKWWKLGYTHQNGLVRPCSGGFVCVCVLGVGLARGPWVVGRSRGAWVVVHLTIHVSIDRLTTTTTQTYSTPPNFQQITKTLSPFEQKIVSPMLEDAPAKVRPPFHLYRPLSCVRGLVRAHR